MDLKSDFFFLFLRHVLVKCWKGEQKDAKSTLKSSTLIYVVNLLSLSSDFLKSKVINKQKQKKLHTHCMCIKSCVYFLKSILAIYICIISC